MTDRVPQASEGAFRSWVQRRLGEYFEDGTEELSDYVLVLLRKQLEGAELRRFLHESLAEMLEDHTESFVSALLSAIESRSFDRASGRKRRRVQAEQPSDSDSDPENVDPRRRRREEEEQKAQEEEQKAQDEEQTRKQEADSAAPRPPDYAMAPRGSFRGPRPGYEMARPDMNGSLRAGPRGGFFGRPGLVPPMIGRPFGPEGAPPQVVLGVGPPPAQPFPPRGMPIARHPRPPRAGRPMLPRPNMPPRWGYGRGWGGYARGNPMQGPYPPQGALGAQPYAMDVPYEQYPRPWRPMPHQVPPHGPPGEEADAKLSASTQVVKESSATADDGAEDAGSAQAEGRVFTATFGNMAASKDPFAPKLKLTAIAKNAGDDGEVANGEDIGKKGTDDPNEIISRRKLEWEQSREKRMALRDEQLHMLKEQEKAIQDANSKLEKLIEEKGMDKRKMQTLANVKSRLVSIQKQIQDLENEAKK